MGNQNKRKVVEGWTGHARSENGNRPQATTTHLDVLVHHPLRHGLGLLGFSVAQQLIELGEALNASASRLGGLQHRGKGFVSVERVPGCLYQLS